MSRDLVAQQALDPTRRKELKAKGWLEHDLLILDMNEPMNPLLKRLAEDHGTPRYGVRPERRDQPKGVDRSAISVDAARGRMQQVRRS